MKYFRLILLLALISFTFSNKAGAQKLPFTELDSMIQSSIEKGEWISVLELAKAQIKSDVDRAEGYYYSALAFYNLGKYKMAKPYMTQLRKMDLMEFETRVEDLNSKLNSGENHNRKEAFFLNYNSKKGEKLYDRTFLSFVYDPKIPFGIAYGSINHHGIATYFLIRANSEIFTQTGEITVRSNGSVFGNQGKDTEATGMIRRGAAELLMGITWKIHQPVWMYFGAGLNHSREFWEITVFEEDGSVYGQFWARNTEVNLNQAVLESGIILDFKGLNLRGGTSLVGFDFSKMRYNLGIGVSFKRK